MVLLPSNSTTPSPSLTTSPLPSTENNYINSNPKTDAITQQQIVSRETRRINERINSMASSLATLKPPNPNPKSSTYQMIMYLLEISFRDLDWDPIRNPSSLSFCPSLHKGLYSRLWRFWITLVWYQNFALQSPKLITFWSRSVSVKLRNLSVFAKSQNRVKLPMPNLIS
jgi:hypothetical protein